MKVRISGIEEKQYETMVGELNKLVEQASGPLRCETESYKVLGKRVTVTYLRTRTWGEYFYEKVVASTEKIAAAENQARAAITHVFDPILNRMRGTGTMQEANRWEIWIERLQARVFDSQPVRVSTSAPSSLKKIKAINGLLQVPPGVAVCAASPLQFIANVVIVSSATDKSADKSTLTKSENATLRRASRTFKKAWARIENPRLPALATSGKLLARPRKPGVTIHLEGVATSDGLHHVQNLQCIADDETTRGLGNPLDNPKIESTQWKAMYLALWSLAPAEGSLVQELYPDRWEDNPGGTGKKRPFYSNANIQGAAQAGLEISKRIRPDAKPPISVMFTVANDQARTALARAISIWASPSLGPPIVSDLSSPNSSQAQRPDMDAAGVGDLPGIDEDK